MTKYLCNGFATLGIWEQMGTLGAIIAVAIVGIILVRNALEGVARDLVLGFTLLGIAGYLGVTFAPVVIPQIPSLLGL
jgi:hypothetical protein